VSFVITVSVTPAKNEKKSILPLIEVSFQSFKEGIA
jgi:hypothetical protein